MQKFLISLFVVLAVASSAHAVRDNLAGPNGSNPDKTITNRSMDRSYNLQTIQTAWDDDTSGEGVSDWNFNATEVLKLRLREWMNTTVVLPENEHIKDVSLGDEGNFSFLPLTREGNIYKFIVFGKLPGADTSLTVHGESGNIYPFYLRIDDHNSPFIPDILVRIHDIKLADFKSKRLMALKQKEADLFKPEGQNEDTPDYLREVAKTLPSEWNFEYQIDPPQSYIAPRQIFDDGIFTYFRYGKDDNMDRVGSLPVIYRVMDGHDVMVNIRVEGEYLVAETVNDNWTIRSGDKFVCVRKRP